MGNLELMILSAALGTDLFSIAIPLGMNRVARQVILRAAVVFAVFHIVMILTGYHVGHYLGALLEKAQVQYFAPLPMFAVQNWASMLGAVVLTGLGVSMIKNHITETPPENKRQTLSGMPLFLLALSVSIDALAAGFSMGMMDVDTIKLSVILGLVIFVIAICGLSLGRRVGKFAGKYSELAGGLVLVLLGLNIVRTIWGF
ncbi:MAG: manganese efflux pump MntP family protein [Pelosinus sp.]|nr:manganese efflux pump MntP family protein [Pelosinus sp.]